MNLHGTGNKTGEQRQVNLLITGTDAEFVHLIDELDRLSIETCSPALTELVRQINWSAGNQINHAKPSGTISI